MSALVQEKLGAPAPAARLCAVPAIGPDSLPTLLRRYREQHRLTVRDAGALVGGSHSVWSQWERDAVPNLHYLRRLGSLLDMSLSQMRAAAGPDRVRRAASVGDGDACQLAQWRAVRCLSASALARRLHVSLALVSRWECGERSPGERYWQDLADILAVPFAEVAAHFCARRARSDTANVRGLRSCRERAGKTQRALAQVAGVDLTTIQRWETRGTAPVHQARRLEAALDTSLAELAIALPVRPRPQARVTPLRRLRLERGLPTRVAAARVGVSPTALLAWERGDNRPSWRHARALAQTLSVPVAVVFDAAQLDRPRLLARTGGEIPLGGPGLRELRRWYGITQLALATSVGVSSSNVAAWEKSKHWPSRRSIERLRDAFS